jgi:hypothetical protein
MSSRKRVVPVVWGVVACGAIAWASAVSFVPAPDGSIGPATRQPTSPLNMSVDSIMPLADVARAARACAPGCAALVYAWTPRMPLSRPEFPRS